ASLYIDALTPATGATGLLTHGLTTTTNPFTAVSYRGDYATGGFGMVFLSVPFESISTSAANPNNQTVFLKRTLDFLAGTVGISVSAPSATATTEAGGTVSIQVSLLAPPTANVTVPVATSDLTEGTVSVGSLIFTPTNWNVPQAVTVTGVNDDVDDGNVAYSIVFGATNSTDTRYNGLDPADTSLTNTDNDTAGITIGAISGVTTSESGTSVTFTIQLNSQPTANVTVPLSSSDTTEGTVSQSQVAFTASNWNQPVTITVTGVDDTIFDGNIAYTVAIAATTSTDPLYNGVNPADFSITNLDNEVEPPTKFFVVDDGTTDRNYHYDSNGAAIKNYAINSGNTAPRGIATTSAGTKLWVVDNNKKVFVYTNTGTLLGSWTAGSLASNAIVEGIATDGTNIWIVDARADRVYYYA
ncbi:MAG: Calx-beta domain-containing protein, partial [Pirellula sp.]